MLVADCLLDDLVALGDLVPEVLNGELVVTSKPGVLQDVPKSQSFLWVSPCCRLEKIAEVRTRRDRLEDIPEGFSV